MTLPSANLRPIYESPIMRLTSPISDVATDITLDGVSGVQTEPNILVIWEEGKREILYYSTAPAGNTLTVTRGYGDSTAQSFNSGAFVARLVSYLDILTLQTNQEYLDSLLPDGDIAGTTDEQTLTNKTITSESNTLTVDGGVL